MSQLDGADDHLGYNACTMGHINSIDISLMLVSHRIVSILSSFKAASEDSPGIDYRHCTQNCILCRDLPGTVPKFVHFVISFSMYTYHFSFHCFHLSVAVYFIPVRTPLTKELSHILLFAAIVSLSVIVYFLIRVPSTLPHSYAVHKLWLYISILHMSWLVGCAALTVFSGEHLFESMYFFGLMLYLVSGAFILLWICLVLCF